MSTKQLKKYDRPNMQTVHIEMSGSILSGSVNVGDWNNGGSLGGGEATENAAQRRGSWGNIWNE